MRTFMNFTLAILLLLAFVGSGVFFVMVSQDLKLERVQKESASAANEESSDTSGE